VGGRSGDVGAACGVGRIVGHVPPRRPGCPYRRLASGTACSVRLLPPRNAITRTAYPHRSLRLLAALIPYSDPSVCRPVTDPLALPHTAACPPAQQTPPRRSPHLRGSAALRLRRRAVRRQAVRDVQDRPVGPGRPIAAPRTRNGARARRRRAHTDRGRGQCAHCLACSGTHGRTARTRACVRACARTFQACAVEALPLVQPVRSAINAHMIALARGRACAPAHTRAHARSHTGVLTGSTTTARGSTRASERHCAKPAHARAQARAQVRGRREHRLLHLVPRPACNRRSH
jgi:hypothetical protein